MRREDWIEEILKSVKIGFVLFFTAVLSLMLNRDMVHLELFSEKIFLVMGCYIGSVIIIRLILSSKFIQKTRFLFSGAAIVWWSFLVYFIISIISSFLVDYVRNIVIMHLAIALFAAVGNYLYMRYVSKELNGSEWKKSLFFWRIWSGNREMKTSLWSALLHIARKMRWIWKCFNMESLRK